jgi:hypothetical protein
MRAAITMSTITTGTAMAAAFGLESEDESSTVLSKEEEKKKTTHCNERNPQKYLPPFTTRQSHERPTLMRSVAVS